MKDEKIQGKFLNVPTDSKLVSNKFSAKFFSDKLQIFSLEISNARAII